MSELDPFVLLIAFAAALAAGMVNSMAGGGTLLTFPSLLALGLESKIANATSTLGLWPGSLGGAWGYRQEIRRSEQSLLLFFVPSLLGGLTGGLLLLWTEENTFKWLVPWLILGATVLFMLQGAVTRWLGRRSSPLSPLGRGAGGEGLNHGKLNPSPQPSPQRGEGEDKCSPGWRRWALVVPLQFLVAVYGGYFGAGIGILMLATLGFLGIDDIHQRNGVKNLGALCINGVALLTFILFGLVDWPVALVMAVGALVGGYSSAGIARRIGPARVRYVVIAVGLLATAWTAWEQFVRS